MYDKFRTGRMRDFKATIGAPRGWLDICHKLSFAYSPWFGIFVFVLHLFRGKEARGPRAKIGALAVLTSVTGVWHMPIKVGAALQ